MNDDISVGDSLCIMHGIGNFISLKEEQEEAVTNQEVF